MRHSVSCLGLIFLLAGCREQPMSLAAVSVPAIDSQATSSDAGLTLASSGEVLLSWIGGDTNDLALYVARSADHGVTWSAATRVAGGAAAPGEVHPHGESSPRIVAAPGANVAIIWANSVPAPSRKWPAAMMRFSRSGDGGKSWSAPVTLNDDTAGAPVSHQFHGAAWSGDSGIVVAWLDERASGGMPRASEPDATIYLASSDDFGRSWEANRPLWGVACPCCRVSLARGADGRVISAWRKHYSGDVRDVVLASLDADSSQLRRVQHDDWVYPGCPHTGPAVAVNAAGNHVVWYTGKKGGAGVFYSRTDGTDSGTAVPLLVRPTLPPAHVSVAALADGGALAAYDVDGAGKREVTLAWVLADGSVRAQARVPGSEQGTYPQLVVAGAQGAVVAWTEPTDAGARVRVAGVRLSGR